MCFHFGIEGVEVLVVVCHKFVKCFLFRFDCGVGHFIIPFFQKGNTFSGAHPTEDKGNFDLIGGVNSWVDGEVGFHRLEPLQGF